MKPSWPFGPQRNMKMEYRQGLKFKIPNPKSQIPNSKQCLVFDAWDLEFKQEELFSHEKRIINLNIIPMHFYPGRKIYSNGVNMGITLEPFDYLLTQ